MYQLSFSIKGIPMSKQSAKHSYRNGHIHSYQPKEKVEGQANIRAQIVQQLPEGFTPFDGLVMIEYVTFVFPFPKTFPKWKMKQIQTGVLIFSFKTTIPDLPDNLKKMPYDAMKGVVYIDDSLIAYEGSCKKVYGTSPGTYITLTGYYAHELEKPEGRC